MTGDFFRWIVLFVVLTSSAIGVYYTYENNRPCTRPITYAIGSVDSRFGISTSSLIADAELAATIWNRAEGKTVLTYDPKAAMKVSFIYDAREANAQLGNAIAQQQADSDGAHTALDDAQAQYSAQQSAYNQTVSAINARGGATRTELVSLNAQRSQLTALGNSLNAAIASYNASVRALNDQVSQFNQSAGHTFEEGKYIQDSAGRRIEIYEFIGTVQLERVLAHEFGHAIGLDHNTNPKSIMYAQNESGNLIPTTDDLAALKAICGK